MTKTIIFEDENIRIIDNNHYWDFVSYVENKTEKRILFAIPGFDELESINMEPVELAPNGWFGLLAGEQDDDFEMLKIGRFEYKIVKTGYDLVKEHGFVLADGRPFAK